MNSRKFGELSIGSTEASDVSSSCTASGRMLERRATAPEFTGQMGRGLTSTTSAQPCAAVLPIGGLREPPELRPVPTPPSLDLSSLGADLTWSVLDRVPVPDDLGVVAMHLTELTMAVARIRAVLDAMGAFANDDDSCGG